MAFVFAALAPPSPLLLPSIGKQYTNHLKPTIEGFHKLREDLYAAKPDVIVIMSAPANLKEEGFFSPLSQHYKADLSQFGDFTLDRPLAPAMPFINSLAEDMSRTKQPYRLIPESKIAYEAAIPLWLIIDKLPSVTIAPIYSGHNNFVKPINFGQELYKSIQQSTQRIAIIVTGYLSYTMSDVSPAGYHKSGPVLVKEVKTRLRHNTLGKLTKLKPKQVESAHSSAFLPLLILAGVLENTPYDTQQLSYQEEFGAAFQITEVQVG